MYKEISSCVCCRNLCCLVAVDIWRLCACRIFVFILPATRNGMEAASLSQIEIHAKSHGGMDEGEAILGLQR